jgi:hypothetical protein
VLDISEIRTGIDFSNKREQDIEEIRILLDSNYSIRSKRCGLVHCYSRYAKEKQDSNIVEYNFSQKHHEDEAGKKRISIPKLGSDFLLGPEKYCTDIAKGSKSIREKATIRISNFIYCRFEATVPDSRRK